MHGSKEPDVKDARTLLQEKENPETTTHLIQASSPN